mmetsp:Transcript_70256/g.199317  ORF Transcript_70256/g.199317 Transcript_70256/m.199317 type:complete len:211 (+) Transcript_70256:1045-1677(+)
MGRSVPPSCTFAASTGNAPSSADTPATRRPRPSLRPKLSTQPSPHERSRAESTAEAASDPRASSVTASARQRQDMSRLHSRRCQIGWTVLRKARSSERTGPLERRSSSSSSASLSVGAPAAQSPAGLACPIGEALVGCPGCSQARGAAATQGNCTTAFAGRPSAWCPTASRAAASAASLAASSVALRAASCAASVRWLRARSNDASASPL